MARRSSHQGSERLVSLLDLYHRLPPSLRNVAASAHGWRLRRRRYGSETETLVKAALERETWTQADWSDWQSERLRRLLGRARSTVPYYRDLSIGRGKSGSRPGRDLAEWPILTKSTLRARPERFLADDCRPGRMIQEHTSGSTGSPLTLWWSRQTSLNWYALVEARSRQWNSTDRHVPWAILGGQLVAPVSQTRPPFWVWNGPMKQLYLSSYHLEKANVGAYLEALEERGVRTLLGYPSAMAALASMALESGIPVPSLEVAFSNAEPLWDHQRAVIAEAFRCNVRDSYGLAELTAAASECEAGSLHIWPEVGILEVLADDSDVPVTPGEPGRLVATGLLNLDMPLVRYETGDRVALRPPSATCPCGRNLPMLASLEGRTDDEIITPGGRRIGRLDPVFKGDLPIREAQIVQLEIDRILVRVVPTPGWNDETEERLRKELTRRVGTSIRIDVSTQDQPLPRGPGGKLRSVVSDLPGASGGQGAAAVRYHPRPRRRI